MNKRFLLLQSRAEVEATDDEYQAFLKFSGLTSGQLEAVDLLAGPQIDLSKYQGVIMAGGPLNYATPDDEKSVEQRQLIGLVDNLMQQIVANDIPFFGACLGVGALVTAMGGQMSYSAGEPAGAVDINIEHSDPILADVPRVFRAFVGHKEGAADLPAGFEVLASSKTCPQIIKVKNNIYATQFHPELDAAGLALRLRLYKNRGYADPDEVEDVLAVAQNENIYDASTPLKNFVRLYG